MEVSKAENMIKHRETILSRPARTWFQSEKEKAESRAAGKQVLENKTDKNSDVNKVRSEKNICNLVVFPLNCMYI